MLSAISWVNRGDDDGFTDVFGTELIDTNYDGMADTPRDAVARGVIDAAIDAWERVIVNFNFSDGSNTFELTVKMFDTGAGFNGTGGVRDVLDGKPTSGLVRLGRGADLDGDRDGLGDGGGWFLDPTPEDHSEFLGNIVNAYAGDAIAGGPAAGLNDFYTLATVEISHALGFSRDSRLSLVTGGLLTNTNIPDPSFLMDTDDDGTPDTPNGTYWVFNSPLIDHLLSSGGAGASVDYDRFPAHTPEPNPDNPVEFEGMEYISAHDVNNGRYEGARRYLVPNTARLMLEAAYGFTTVNPAQFGTMYASLDEVTGELVIRGGTGDSNDLISVSLQGDQLFVGVNVGDDVPGTGPFPGDEDLPAFQSFFPVSDIQSIMIEASGGSDLIIVDIPRFADTTPVTIQGGLGSDTIWVKGLGSRSPLQIDGGNGNDTIVLANGMYATDIQGDVTIFGGSGADTLTIDDQQYRTGIVNQSETETNYNTDEYNIETGSFQKIESYTRVRPGFSSETYRLNSARTTFNSIAEVTLKGSGTTGEDVEGGSAEFNINGVAAGTTLIVEGNGGEDIFNVGRTDFDRYILGSVVIRGGAQRDRLNIDDRSGLTDADYTITSSRFSKSTTSGNVQYSSISTFELDANDKNNTIDVLSSGGALLIRANDGNDSIRVVPTTRNLDDIRGGLSIFGGEGEDEVIVDDSNFTMNGSPGTLPYYVRSNSIQKEFYADPNIPFGKFLGLGYDDVEYIALGAAAGPNVITVYETPAETQFRLVGGGGSDTFVVGNGDFDSHIRGEVVINGGTGFNQLIIDDSDDVGNDQYLIDAGSFTKRSTGTSVQNVPLLRYELVGSLGLAGSDSGNAFIVNGTHADTTYGLRGNGGQDTFVIQAGGLTSNVSISGGEPTSSPGDSLRLTIDHSHVPEFVPNGTGAGAYQFADDISVVYTGLETATAAYPGDFNLDGVVSDEDRAIYLATFGTSVNPPGTGADANGDGIVNAADGVLLRNYMGSQYPPAGEGSGAETAYVAAFETLGAPMLQTEMNRGTGAVTGRWRPANRIAFPSKINDRVLEEMQNSVAAALSEQIRSSRPAHSDTVDFATDSDQDKDLPVPDEFWQDIASGRLQMEPTCRIS